MKRVLLGLTIAGVVFAGIFAFAASLTVNPSTLQAGTGAVGQCNAAAVSVSFPPPTFTSGTGYTVNSVTVGNVNASACNAKTLYVTVADGGNVALSSGSAAITGSGTVNVTVNLAAPVSAASALNAHVAIS